MRLAHMRPPSSWILAPLLELLELLELLAFRSPQQSDRPVLQPDFVDGSETFPLVGAGENHVDGRLSLRFEPLQRGGIQRPALRVDSIYIEVDVFAGHDRAKENVCINIFCVERDNFDRHTQLYLNSIFSRSNRGASGEKADLGRFRQKRIDFRIGQSQDSDRTVPIKVVQFFSSRNVELWICRQAWRPGWTITRSGLIQEEDQHDYREPQDQYNRT
jgi:hypothetical protein